MGFDSPQNSNPFDPPFFDSDSWIDVGGAGRANVAATMQLAE
jgi:hypothetical protein